jgi:phospholipase/carboxylesterase
MKSKPSVHLIHGDADPVVPIEASRRAMDVLSDVGVSVSMVERPGLQHGIDEGGLQSAGGYLMGAFG